MSNVAKKQVALIATVFFSIFLIIVLSQNEKSAVEYEKETATFQPKNPVVKTSKQKIISVKYGSSVDVGHSRFEYLNTTGSSLVRGAWYDSSNRYMVINLNGTSYQYCRMPSSAWSRFKRASSFGTYYTRSIKGSYDCRLGGIPSYAK